MGKGDIPSGIIFGILFFVFLILAIAVPVSMLAATEGELCDTAQTETLLRDEQLMCFPEHYDETWTAAYDQKGADNIKVYKASKKNTPMVNRHHNWVNLSRHIGGKYVDNIYFKMSSVQSVDGTARGNCTGDDCEKVKVYFADQDSFYKHFFDSYGRFRTYGTPIYTFSNETNANNQTEFEFRFSKTEGPKVYYLITSNTGRNTVVLDYDMYLDYQVFDLSSIKAEKCEDYKCDFSGLTNDDVIVMEYKDSSDTTNVWGNQNDSAVYSLNASVYTIDVDWSGVLGTGLAFGIIALICLAIAIALLFKILKKLGKIGKKAAKKAKKEAEKSTAMTDVSTSQPVAAQPVAAAPVAAQPGYDPNMQAAYAQPGYDPNMQAGYAQPYPGQPYPGQPVA